MFAFFIHHILGHIPYWFWPFFIGIGIAAYFVLGIAGVVASLAPQFKPYVSAARLASVAVVFFSVFMFGAEGTINVYKQDQQVDEGVVAVGKQQSEDTTKQIASDLADKQGDVKTNTVYVTKYIHDKAPQIDAGCTISDEAFDAYNQAVTNGANQGDKK